MRNPGWHAAAMLAVALLAAAPGGADHAAACTDEYMCTSAGTVMTVQATLPVDGASVTVEAQRWTEQRFSSEGHLERDQITATVSVPGMPSCSPDPASITFEASNVVEDVRVASTDPACSFDLVWTSAGQPGADVDRRTEASPGIPRMFDTLIVVSLGASASSGATVAGTVGDSEAQGEGSKEEHEYIGHVTLLR